jgi:hypothetical protein
MRNIHFKAISGDKWVFGDLAKKGSMLFVGNIEKEYYEIAAETLSEFTGVVDYTQWNNVPEDEQKFIVSDYNNSSSIKETVQSFAHICHGVPIYENDILECVHIVDEKLNFRSPVKYRNGCFGVELRNEEGCRFLNFHELMEYKYFVIGNVFKPIPFEEKHDDKK